MFFSYYHDGVLFANYSERRVKDKRLLAMKDGECLELPNGIMIERYTLPDDDYVVSR